MGADCGWLAWVLADGNVEFVGHTGEQQETFAALRIGGAPPTRRHVPHHDCRDHFEKAITYGSDKHATQYERERGAVAAARLRQVRGQGMQGSAMCW